ncbi:MAG: CRISPR-associated protein Csm5 [Sedimenticola sp.]|nr:MAG: CRISPR-associated protein Csm5 [Sedimenticola sp.]
MNNQHWNLAITPLSPVHMGSGADYEPTGYVIDDGVLYEFDSISALSVLPVDQRNKLDAILRGRANQNMLLQVQSFFYANREDLKNVSRNQVHINSTTEAFYKDRIGSISQRDSKGGKIHNKLEIERTAWSSAQQQSIIPGTGLKGAIRTALLNESNNNQPLEYVLKKDRQANKKLQEKLFGGSFHTDPMRLLRLGDASIKRPEQFATQVWFALNRKKQPVTDVSGNLRQSKAEQAGLYQLLECLPALLPRSFISSLEIQSDNSMSKNKWPCIQFDLEQVANACNNFYFDRFNQEIALLKTRGYLDKNWGTQIDYLLSESWLKHAMQNGRAFLLRIGRHSGAESVTLNGLRNIKIMRGKSEKPDNQDHSKTLWLAGNERNMQTNMQPFGWVLVEIFEKSEKLPEWPENTVNRDIIDWYEKNEQRQKLRAENIRKRLETEEMALNEKQKRQLEIEAIEQARLKAEAEELERRQAEYNALSINHQTIYQLQELLDAFRSQPETLRDGSEINRLLNSLIDTAIGWTDIDEREVLAKFMEVYYDQVGWFQSGVKSSKKKKQEEKKRFQIDRIRKGNQ